MFLKHEYSIKFVPLYSQIKEIAFFRFLQKIEASAGGY